MAYHSNHVAVWQSLLLSLCPSHFLLVQRVLPASLSGQYLSGMPWCLRILYEVFLSTLSNVFSVCSEDTDCSDDDPKYCNLAGMSGLGLGLEAIFWPWSWPRSCSLLWPWHYHECKPKTIYVK